MLIQRLAIIGVGLIGGSLARALRQKRQCRSVVGFGRNPVHLDKAVELGVIDEYSLTVASAVRDADMVVLATPLDTTSRLLQAMRNYLGRDTVITDVGSAKGSVVEAARNTLGDCLPRFIPGHPIAGKEQSGVEASVADLFDSHRVILTPLPENSVQALERVTKMWEITGADVVQLDVEQHDEILAATSHLPHMLAYALVDCLAGMKDSDEIFRFAAGGFADFTRIASSDPQMWHDICIANRQYLLSALNHFDQHLNNIRQAIENDDSKSLLKIFTRAKKARDQFTRSSNRHNDAPE
ncbi:MAG TPA: prephenate dehydrogenase/arogenate dehydrogenase family protein [Gammaproteobacteria bacterium]|nr:prephenate dehydrogenase/arogenate dehydrogenase family protein [Gammaproteobacteria bacterium]